MAELQRCTIIGLHGPSLSSDNTAQEGTAGPQPHFYPLPPHTASTSARKGDFLISTYPLTLLSADHPRINQLQAARAVDQGAFHHAPLDHPRSRQWRMPSQSSCISRWFFLCFFSLFTRKTLCKSNLSFAGSCCAAESWWRGGEGKRGGEEDGALFAISCSEEQRQD